MGQSRHFDDARATSAYPQYRPHSRHSAMAEKCQSATSADKVTSLFDGHSGKPTSRQASAKGSQTQRTSQPISPQPGRAYTTMPDNGSIHTSWSSTFFTPGIFSAATW